MEPVTPAFPCANDVVRDLTKNAIRAKPLIPFHTKEVYAPFRLELKENLGAQASTVDEYRKILETSVAIRRWVPGRWNREAAPPRFR